MLRRRWWCASARRRGDTPKTGRRTTWPGQPRCRRCRPTHNWVRRWLACSVELRVTSAPSGVRSARGRCGCAFSRRVSGSSLTTQARATTWLLAARTLLHPEGSGWLWSPDLLKAAVVLRPAYGAFASFAKAEVLAAGQLWDALAGEAAGPPPRPPPLGDRGPRRPRDEGETAVAASDCPRSPPNTCGGRTPSTARQVVERGPQRQDGCAGAQYPTGMGDERAERAGYGHGAADTRPDCGGVQTRASPSCGARSLAGRVGGQSSRTGSRRSR